MLNERIPILEYDPKTFKLIKEHYSLASVCRLLWYKQFITVSKYLDSNTPLKGRLWYRKNSWT